VLVQISEVGACGGITAGVSEKVFQETVGKVCAIERGVGVPKENGGNGVGKKRPSVSLRRKGRPWGASCWERKVTSSTGTADVLREKKVEFRGKKRFGRYGKKKRTGRAAVSSIHRICWGKLEAVRLQGSGVETRSKWFFREKARSREVSNGIKPISGVEIMGGISLKQEYRKLSEESLSRLVPFSPGLARKIKERGHDGKGCRRGAIASRKIRRQRPPAIVFLRKDRDTYLKEEKMHAEQRLSP